MKINLKPILWVKDIDSSGKCPIAIRISGGGKRTYYQTEIKVAIEYFSKSGKILKGSENYDINNARLNAMIADAQREILNNELQGQSLTIYDVKAIFNPKIKKSKNFIEFYKDHIDYVKTKFSPGYYKHFKVEYDSLNKFAGDSLSFESITSEFLEKYEMSLGSKKKTTMNTKLKRLKEVIDKAIDRELINKKQIAGYKFPGYKKPSKNYLTLKHIGEISNYIYKGELDDDLEAKKVCCYFLIECCSGIRYSDWKNFEIEKLISKRNFKVRTKKNGEPVYLPLEIFTSLDKIVNYINANKILFDLTVQATNRILKDIGRRLKLTFPLTTHVGRHTFGTMLGELGYSTAKIAEAMGISEETAKTYIHQTRRGFSEEAKKYGGW